MDINVLCKKIFDAVNAVAEKLSSPIAYINIRTGKDFPYSDDELCTCFSKTAWDTRLSSADLNITHDAAMNDCLVKIEDITDFIDDEGKNNVYHVKEADSIIR